MNTGRLLMLADYLEGVEQFEGKGVPVEMFDLENWMDHPNNFGDGLARDGDNLPLLGETFKEQKISLTIKKIINDNAEPLTLLKPVNCQTAGCAVGWAATIPEFNNQGFYLGISEEYNEDNTEFYADPVYINKETGTVHVAFNAVHEFFGIDSDTTSRLFLSHHYENSKDPIAVATRIRELCAGKDITDTE